MKEKTGLVLEGGALRGLFSAGVMDVLMENGVEFDGIIGVSAGAAFGCNYKSRQPGRAIRYNMKFAKDWRYCSVRSLIKTGDLFGGEFDYHYLPTYLDIFDTKAFDENPMEFYAVCAVRFWKRGPISFYANRSSLSICSGAGVTAPGCRPAPRGASTRRCLRSSCDARAAHRRRGSGRRRRLIARG